MLVRPSLVITRENKILLLKYIYTGNEVYGIPGGNPEPNDTMVQAIIRELKEELNLEVKVNELLLTGEVISPEKSLSTLHCVFRGTITKGIPQINPEETSALDTSWIDIDKIDSLNLYPNVGRDLKQLLTGSETRNNTYIGRINQKWF